MRRLLLSLVTALALPLLACDDSSTDPGGPALMFSGVMTTEAESFHPISVERNGTVRITLVSLTPLEIDLTRVDPTRLRVVIGLGQVVEAECVETSQFVSDPGDQLLYGLAERDYCVSVFSGGLYPAGSEVGYELTVQLP